jgi:WD40-like Beta Propeller Repeat
MSRRDRDGLRLSCLLVLTLAAAALAPSLAQADVFGPISLASASAIAGVGNQQAVYAHDSAISGNGRYVAFDGSYAGRTGVWVRDLQTGAVEAVAAEDPDDPSISAPDASLPSISDDGRFVSFTTTAQLDPVDDTNHAPDVYVRDMDVAAGEPCEPGPGSAQPCAFTLVSAVDGANAGLSYEQPVEGEKNFGSIAAGRSAISADGREIAFVTSAISNLAGPGTPALQVAVRYLDSDHTELVSVADEPATGNPLPGQPVSGFLSETYGAVFTGAGGAAPRFSVPEAYPTPVAVGASISGDGSTVAWMGVDIAKQTRTLPGETLNPNYAEPLWRRIGDPSAPIHRVTGGSDPANPACAASGEAVLPEQPSAADPCQGPFFGAQMGRSFGLMADGEFVDPVPQMSRDGYTVAFLADAPLVALGSGFGTSELHTDLYLADMREGLTRSQALRQLTELASVDQGDVAEDSPIEDVAISPDGSHVAFTTKRTVFPLGSPAYVSAPAGAPGMLELFSIDLADDTLARVTGGFDGGPSEHPHAETVSNQDPYTLTGDGALSPSFTDDGNTMAFSSTASNLVFGDGNTPPLKITSVDGSDAFVVSRVLFDPLPTPQSISAPPAGPALTGAWRLGVTAHSRADGTVLLYVSLPGAGTATASARSTIRVRVKRHGRIGTSVATRSVATTKKISRAGAGALVTLTLKLAPKYRSLANKRPGLAGTVSVTFAAAHHPTLRASVRASFLHIAKRGKKTAKKANAKSRPRLGSSAKGASR